MRLRQLASCGSPSLELHELFFSQSPVQVDPQPISPLGLQLLVATALFLSSLRLAPFQIQANPSQSVLTLEGEDVGELDKAMQHVSYLNSRQFPTPGIRRLKITSTVKYVLVFNNKPVVAQ